MASGTRAYARDYRILEEAAESLRDAEAVDITALGRIVERAAKAHRACRSRLDAVERLLDEGDEA